MPTLTRHSRALAAGIALAVLAAGALVHSATAAPPTGAQLVATARTLLGSPYQWGGTTPAGFDCSGFVGYVLKAHGITPPRTSAQLHEWTRTVSRANLQPGDLIFKRYSGRNGSKADHVDVYAGDGMVVGTSTAKGSVVERPIVERAVIGYGRVPGVAVDAPPQGTSWGGQLTRAETARVVADTLGLPDQSNPFGVRTEAGAVGAVYRSGIGYPYRDGKWRPNVQITGRQLELWLKRSTATRAEAARILADVLGLPDQPNPFGVVTQGGAVGALHSAGIAYPYRDGLFRPHAEITDRQVELWIGRAGG